MNTRRAQSGVALLTAIVLVAIAAVVATTIAFNSAMTARVVGWVTWVVPGRAVSDGFATTGSAGWRSGCASR